MGHRQIAIILISKQDPETFTKNAAFIAGLVKSGFVMHFYQ